jgi:DNA-binding NarL/FixJ family response regulator
MATFSPDFIIADAHTVYSCGLSTYLKQHFTGCTVTEVTHADALLAAAAQQWFDVILMNARLQQPDAFETARHLKQLYARCCLVMYSTERNEQLRLRAHNSGAAAFFYTDEPIEAALHIIEEVLQKDVSTAAAYTWQHKQVTENNSVVITRREKEVLQLIKKGLSSKQMAEKLFIAPKTIDNHRHRLMHKTNCHNAAQLLRYWEERGNG